MNEVLREIYKRVKASEKVLLMTHNNPDGDALSSLSAMMEILLYLNKSFTAFCPDKYPDYFDFLPNLEKIIYNKTLFNFLSFDLLISLDCGSLSRTGLVDEIKNRNSKQTYIEIDHHPETNEGFADLIARDFASSATTEIIYHFCKANNLLINNNLANCILTGLITDTGNFVYPSTSANSLAIASEMLRIGAKLPQIVSQTCRNKNLATLKLWGLAMSRMRKGSCGLIFTILTKEDFEEFSADEDMADGVSGFLGNMPEVPAVLLLRQTSPDLVKGSLRTCRSDIDVGKLARFFGGGGHAKASGFAIKGNLRMIDGNWAITD